MTKKSRLLIIFALLSIFCLLIYLVYDYVNENANKNENQIIKNNTYSNENNGTNQSTNIPKEEIKENQKENKNKNYNVKEIVLNGEENITVKLNSKYNELGAKAINVDNEDISDQIEIMSDVDTKKKGTYKVYYKIGNWIKVRYVTVE